LFANENLLDSNLVPALRSRGEKLLKMMAYGYTYIESSESCMPRGNYICGR